MWRIEFTSAMFRPYLPEESQGNPGVYGFELAQWLSVQLMNRNVVTSYPVGEDWGWLIEYLNEEIELTIGCSSQAEEGDGYTGEPIQWSAFIRSSGGLFKKKGPATDAAVRFLSEHILAVLKEAGIEVTHLDR